MRDSGPAGLVVQLYEAPDAWTVATVEGAVSGAIVHVDAVKRAAAALPVDPAQRAAALRSFAALERSRTGLSDVQELQLFEALPHATQIALVRDVLMANVKVHEIEGAPVRAAKAVLQ